MAGFFKKLFNRITGKPGDEAAPAVEKAALPPPDIPVMEAPLPLPPPLPIMVEEPPPPPFEQDPEEVSFETEETLGSHLRGDDDADEQVEPKKVAAKKVTDKKEVAKKAPPKKEAAKKTAVKKSEPPKPEPKKIEAKKPAPAKVEKAKSEKVKPEKAKPVPPPEPVVPAPTPLPLKERVPEGPLRGEVSEEKSAVEEAPSSDALHHLLPQGEKEEQTHAAPTWDIPPATPILEPAPVAETPTTSPAEDRVEAANIPAIPEQPSRGGWFSRLRSGLSKSSQTITGSITSIFTKRKLDRETLQELEDTLIQADLGVTVAERIIAAVSQGRYDKEIDPEEVKSILASEVAKVLKPVEVPFNFGSEKPFVIMVVGVNGSGKTTTIGKLGSIAAAEGFKVMFAACDTFRAAAIEQLTVWGNRIGATTMSAPQGADAAGLAFDAIKAAQGNGTDILFIDTAGRLQNKAYLMDELDKVVRVIKKLDAQAPHAVLLVLDATTGQNALAQAEIFTKVAGVTGLIMTKLDGTARGGILVAIAEKFKLPIHAIGVGESIADLQPFDAQGFARAIAGFDEE